MSRSSVSGSVLILGLALTATAFAFQAILLEAPTWTMGMLGAGLLSVVIGLAGLRPELVWLASRRRVEIALFGLGTVGVLFALGYFSARFSHRFDLTESGLHSLAPQTEAMLDALDRPVQVTFFHDRLMRETVELYELMAEHSDQLSVTFHDPTLNPARARTMGVKFAGTSVIESAGQRIVINGPSEADIANGILRATQAAKQLVCFLEGHNEADPFSMESHDHREGAAGVDHSHGLGAEYVLHDRHGLAKARHGLETLNYQVKVIVLAGSRANPLADCSLLIVAGPKIALLAGEVALIRAYLNAGGNGLFMLDPGVASGLEPVLLEYGISLDDSMVIDPASHYWTDVSAPAVTRYNNHRITRDLPLTFFPGARPLMPTDVRIPGTSVTPIVNSSPTSFAKARASSAEFDASVDRKGPQTLMVVSTRRPLADRSAPELQLGTDAERKAARLRELVGDAPERVTGPSKLAVIGDSDFATNSFFHFLGNGNLFLNTVNVLSAQENLIGVEPRTRELPKLSVTNRQLKGTFLLSMLLVPGLLAVAGALMWWQRR